MSESILEVKHLTISLPTNLNLVDDVSFSVKAGEILGLVGESGSGKTLTCRALMQLLPSDRLTISRGEVTFEGHDILTLSDKQLRKIRGQGIGMVFQNPSTHLNPLMTIGEHIIESLNVTQKYSRKDAKEKAIDILAKVGIPSPEKRFHAFSHELSGGMRQRAMIAIALAASPKVLIADEPTTALDVTVQAQILQLLDHLRSEFGVAIILITHDLGVVAQTCDRVVVLYGGRICEVANTKDLLESPQHPYTKGLIDCQPLSDGESKKDSLVAIPGNPPTSHNMPDGCRFHPRCLSASAPCQHQQPSTSRSFSGTKERVIACHFPRVAENQGEIFHVE